MLNNTLGNMSRGCSCSARLVREQARQRTRAWTTAESLRCYLASPTSTSTASTLGLIANRRWASTSVLYKASNTCQTEETRRNPLGLAPRPRLFSTGSSPSSSPSSSSYPFDPRIVDFMFKSRRPVMNRSTDRTMGMAILRATGVRGVRGFRTSSRRELAAASMAFGAAALLKVRRG
jgi:hypothetical protein